MPSDEQRRRLERAAARLICRCRFVHGIFQALDMNPSQRTQTMGVRVNAGRLRLEYNTDFVSSTSTRLPNNTSSTLSSSTRRSPAARSASTAPAANSPLPDAAGPALSRRANSPTGSGTACSSS